jgi:hypothetical protein
LASIWLALILILYVRSGWWSVEGIVKTILPIVLVGYAPVLLYALPWLRGLRRSVSDQETLIRTTHPMLVIPNYAEALASGIAAYHTVFSQPSRLLPTIRACGWITVISWNMLRWEWSFISCMTMSLPSYEAGKRSGNLPE